MNLSSYKLEATFTEALKLVEELPEDERLRRDSIEGETQLFELMDAYAEQAIQSEALAEMARERARRLEARAERHRSVVTGILQGLALSEPVERPLYTASLSHRSKAMVTDADQLPEEYYRTAIDMRRLEAALRKGDVPGATLSNPTPSLTLRTR